MNRVRVAGSVAVQLSNSSGRQIIGDLSFDKPRDYKTQQVVLMSICFRTARAVSAGTLLFALIFVFSLSTPAQTSRAKDRSQPKTATTTNQEKKFLVNILSDQRAIWTSPFHLHRTDAKWLAPLGLSTLALIATDRHTSGE